MVAVAQSLREQVAWACRILALEGYADLTLGHVSARGPDGARSGSSARASRSTRSSRTTSSRSTTADAESSTSRRCCTPGSTRPRPDVGAVVHGHPPYATALGATSGRARAADARRRAVRGRASDASSDPDLIVDDEQGAAVAAALGTRRAVLLRNHGVLVAGKDVPWAVLAAVTLERAARLQSIASTLGRCGRSRPSSRCELQPVKYQDRFVDEYWAAWLRRSAATSAEGSDGDRLYRQRAARSSATSSRRSCCSTCSATGSA